MSLEKGKRIKLNESRHRQAHQRDRTTNEIDVEESEKCEITAKALRVMREHDLQVESIKIE